MAVTALMPIGVLVMDGFKVDGVMRTDFRPSSIMRVEAGQAVLGAVDGKHDVELPSPLARRL